MVIQYPHIATITIPGVEATQDANGNWIAGTAGSTFTQMCRAESASGNGYISGPDGEKIDYSWKVYFPKGIAELKVGANISVMNGTESYLASTVKRFSRGQLNCTAWL